MTLQPIIPNDWASVGYKFWQYTSSGVLAGISGNVDLDVFNGSQEEFDAYLTTISIPPSPPPPISSAWRGLQMRADGNSGTLDFQCIQVARLNGAKLMTNTSFSELDTLLTLVPSRNIVLRLFSAGDDPILGNAQNFFNVQDAWLGYFNACGGKYVEIHNEENLPQEGLGMFWKDASGFSIWYNQVRNLIKAKYPNLQVAMGGLSPQPNVPEWITMMQNNIAKLDWIAAHSYWIDSASMDNAESGRYYRRFLPLGKPIIVTEFANVAATDSDTIKGQQYRTYYTSLESGIIGACAFVSSASNKSFDSTRQTWVRNNSLTAIPTSVGQ